MSGTSVGREAAAFFEQLSCPEESRPKALENVYGAERAQAMPNVVNPGNTADSHVSALDKATSLLRCVADEPRQRPEAMSQRSHSHRPFQTLSEEDSGSAVAGDEDNISIPSSSSSESMATAFIPVTLVAVDVPAGTSAKEAFSSGADVERRAEAFLGQSPSPEEPRGEARENVDSAGEPAQPCPLPRTHPSVLPMNTNEGWEEVWTMFSWTVPKYLKAELDSGKNWFPRR
uniref:Lactoylglutathione lyase ) n=1 Tax=Ganoderma boninense TaxID=34458 RepID=A0A5K1K6D4_9APHY|nr:Lactoylglutathione lyase (EC (Glyoxalase I) [Ganoderma boninense]